MGEAQEAMRLHRSSLWLVAVSVFAFAAWPSSASSAPLLVEAVNEGTGIYGTHHWTNSQQTIIAGKKVTFRNPYTGLPYHGLKFTGSAPSSCSGIPAAASTETGAPNWEGECTFSVPGAYAFICTVHPTEMKGTIIVPGTPNAKTNIASGESQTEGVLNGSIEPEGNAIEYHFEYGTKTLSEHTTSTIILGATDFALHSVSAPVSGLLPEKTYHFKLVATYGVGKTAVATAEQMFTTPAPTAPTVKLSAVTGLKEAEATLNGIVDPNGGEEAKYVFEYGATPAFGQITTPKALPVDNINHSASETLTKLTPGTLYYFKLVAKNKSGENAMEGTFKTLSPAPSEPPPTPPASPPAQEPAVTPSALPTMPLLFAPPLEPALIGGPSLRSIQHGAFVRGSVDIAQSGAGGELAVDLFAKSASLAKAGGSGGSRRVRVGVLVRHSISAGKLSFTVTLTARGRAALHRHRRLGLTVQIVLTPVAGVPASVTRSVVLRG
jgi:plastocyanin